MTHCALLATALAGMLLCASGLKLSQEPSCDCLGWADAKYQGMNCDELGDEQCKNFIMRLPNEKMCLNNYLGITDQWCYVSKDCATGRATEWDLPKGSSGVNWRVCTDDEPYLGQKTFEELVALARTNDMHLSVAAQFAYPIWPGEKLPDVMAHFNIAPPEGAPIEKFKTAPESPDLYKKLEDQKTKSNSMDESSRVMFFDSRDGLPPFGVSDGSKFYWVNYGDEIQEVLDRGFDFLARPGLIEIAKCVAGCETVDPTWWSKLDQ
jgi:hypothetical protein